MPILTAGMTEAGGEGCDRGELDGAGGGMGLPMLISVSGASSVSAIGSISMFASSPSKLVSLHIHLQSENSVWESGPNILKAQA